MTDITPKQQRQLDAFSQEYVAIMQRECENIACERSDELRAFLDGIVRCDACEYNYALYMSMVNSFYLQLLYAEPRYLLASSDRDDRYLDQLWSEFCFRMAALYYYSPPCAAHKAVTDELKAYADYCKKFREGINSIRQRIQIASEFCMSRILADDMAEARDFADEMVVVFKNEIALLRSSTQSPASPST